jgi:hypothetical protein
MIRAAKNRSCAKQVDLFLGSRQIDRRESMWMRTKA